MTHQRFKPGDIVRVAQHTTHEPLARLLRERETEAGFEVVSSVMQKYARYQDEFLSTYEVVQVKYPDGTLSGAIYASIFNMLP